MSFTSTLTKPQRRCLVTFVGAGIAAVFAEHLLKPNLKRKLRG